MVISKKFFVQMLYRVFTDENEYIEFMNYLIEKREQFKLEYNNINIGNDIYSGAQAEKDPRIKQSLRVGTLLVQWLDNWREHVF